jgi:hypothetical protein
LQPSAEATSSLTNVGFSVRYTEIGLKNVTCSLFSNITGPQEQLITTWTANSSKVPGSSTDAWTVDTTFLSNHTGAKLAASQVYTATCYKNGEPGLADTNLVYTKGFVGQPRVTSLDSSITVEAQFHWHEAFGCVLFKSSVLINSSDTSMILSGTHPSAVLNWTEPANYLAFPLPSPSTPKNHSFRGLDKSDTFAIYCAVEGQLSQKLIATTGIP